MTRDKRYKDHPTHLYKCFMKVDRDCFYCGVLAATMDHVPPLMHAFQFVGADGVVFELVPSCKDCNCLAGSTLHLDKLARKKYIHARLLAKSKKLLAMPEWSEDDLEEVEGYLKKQILRAIRKKALVLQRLEHLA